jgi:hypothetical protein
MSEVMTRGIIGMPYEMAMANELSRRQFHGRAQSLLTDYAALEAECERLRGVERQLRQHKNDYMEAAEGTRKALSAELAALKAASGEEVEVVAVVDEADDGMFAEVIDVPGVGCTVKMGDKLMTVAQHQRIAAAMAAESDQLARDLVGLLGVTAERDEARTELDAIRKQEPIQVVAVAIMRSDGDGGVEPEWLLEGGTAELMEGMVLVVAEDGRLTDEDGSGIVYAAPPGAAMDGGMVLPERYQIGQDDTKAMHQRGEGWNACLDELDRITAAHRQASQQEGE